MSLLTDGVILVTALSVFGIMFVFIFTPLFQANGFEGGLFDYLAQGTSYLITSFGSWIACGLFGTGCGT